MNQAFTRPGQQPPSKAVRTTQLLADGIHKMFSATHHFASVEQFAVLWQATLSPSVTVSYARRGYHWII